MLYILETLYVNPPKSNKNSFPSSLILYDMDAAALFTGKEAISSFALFLFLMVVCKVSVA